MKKILLATAVLCASAFAAHAESFTFEGTNKTTGSIVVPMPGSVAASSTSDGSATATFASGKTEKSTTKCAVQTRPPGDQFAATGVCNSTADKGTFGITFACQNADKAKFTSMCWGVLVGLSGDYKGKSGALSWTSTGNAEMSGNTASGGGAWFE